MNEINKTRHTVEKGADQASKVYDDVKDRASDFLDEAKSRTNDLLDDAQSYGKNTWSDAKTWVRKNPGLAVGGAVVVGVLLSTLLGRDND